MNRRNRKCCFEEEDAVLEPEEMEYKECKECKPHPKPRKETVVVLNCGTTTGSAPLSCNCPPHEQHPVVQAGVTLDTDNIINPTIKIDFSALISFKTKYDDYFLHLGFKLSKICAGSHIPLGTWNFEKSNREGFFPIDGAEAPCAPGVPDAPLLFPPLHPSGSLQETDSFSFSWCECNDCPGCCRYIVELVEHQCYNIDFALVSNISFTAMAVGEKRKY
jgi:hypothetical protein